MGATTIAAGADGIEATPRRFPAWLVRCAWLVALTGLLWRHAVGQAPFGADAALNQLFDKWTLGPLRLINLFALIVLVVHHAPLLKRALPRLRFLETLGAASLAVFIAHLVIALLALTYLGAANAQRPVAVDLAVFAGAYALLYAVAYVTQELERRGEAARKRLRARRTQGSRASISRRQRV
jgi:peptidoglycan/LPS O-acetylase OafA/YrhL